MYEITFLKGTAPNYAPSKTFRKEGRIVKAVSGYDAGYYFHHKTVTLPYEHRALCRELITRSADRWFHIQGTPADGLTNTVRRLKQNFGYMPTRGLVIDIDKFKLPPAIAAQWKSPSQKDTIPIIRLVLEHLKLTVLATANFTYVLTSSQLNRSVLSAHLYFFLDQAVNLPDLRRWAMLINKGYGATILDPAVYKSVQPIYISPPTCENFPDPFPIGTRIGYSQPDREKYVAVADLMKLGFTMNKMPTPTQGLEAAYERVSKAAAKATTGIKKNWIDTIEAHVGTDRGVNEPAHRAAAQMVREEGAATIRDSLDHYVSAFHGAMWRAIKTHGKRGNQADIDLYTEDKARSYIESAVDKDFGKRADQLATLVTDALAKAIADGSPAPLTSKDVLKAYSTLEKEHFSKHQEVRLKLKTQARGLVSISAYEKRAKMIGSASAGEFDISDPSRAIKAMFSKITLLITVDGDKYLHWPIDSSPLGYRVVRAASPSCGIYLETYLGQLCGEFATPVVRSMMRAELAGNLLAETGFMVKRGVLVGRRIVSTKQAIYYRAGGHNGTDITVEITSGLVTYKKSSDLPIFWEHTNLARVPIPSSDQLKKVFGTDKPDTQQAIRYVKDKLPKFMNCELDSIPNVMAVAVSLLIRDPLIYLGVFMGTASGGKSFAASAFKLLFDPAGNDESYGTPKVNNLPSRWDEALTTKLMENDVLAFDNLKDTLTKTQQGFFSQVSTGSEESRRILYTQTNENIKLFQCILLSCLSNPITEVDLKSRALEVNFDDPARMKNAVDIPLFVKSAPILRHCWFVITSEVLRVSKAMRSNNSHIGVRDYIVSATRVLFEKYETTSELVSKITMEANTKKAADISNDPLIMMFIAFLDSHSETKLEFLSDDLWQEFKDWVRQNNGQKKKALIHAYDRFIGHPVTVDLMEIPERIKQFETKLGSAHPNIEKISQWDATKGRSKIFKTRRLTIYTSKFQDIL